VTSLPPIETEEIAGLEVEVVRVGAHARTGGPVVYLLHGFDMVPRDLSPFAQSMGVEATFLFPRAPLDRRPLGGRGFAWWPIDVEARDRAMALAAPRDLSAFDPPELPEARARLSALMAEVESRLKPSKVVLGGFSQGAMLSCDHTLHAATLPHALVFLSGARIGAGAWTPLLPRLAGVPVLQTHGRFDHDLSFAAAEALRDDLVQAGAQVTFVPFEGGHETPLPALRSLRRFLLAQLSHDRGQDRAHDR